MFNNNLKHQLKNLDQVSLLDNKTREKIWGRVAGGIKKAAPQDKSSDKKITAGTKKTNLSKSSLGSKLFMLTLIAVGVLLMKQIYQKINYPDSKIQGTTHTIAQKEITRISDKKIEAVGPNYQVPLKNTSSDSSDLLASDSLADEATKDEEKIKPNETPAINFYEHFLSLINDDDDEIEEEDDEKVSKTPTKTKTPTPNKTNTPVPTNTISLTVTPSPVVSYSPAPTPTLPFPSITPTPEREVTPTYTPTNSPTLSLTPSLTITPSLTVRPSFSPTPTCSPCTNWHIFVECVKPNEQGYMVRLGYQWDGSSNKPLDISKFIPGITDRDPVQEFQPGRHTYDVQVYHPNNEVWKVKIFYKTKTATASKSFPTICQD